MPSLLRFVSEQLERLNGYLGYRTAVHMTTARRGELQAYLYLRERGYRILERNLRERGNHGELDLIGWNDGTLCFIEVKTRTGKGLTPPEAAVDPAKKQHLRAVARKYMRHLDRDNLGRARFDIVSVTYPEPGGKPEVRLIKNAFGWSATPRPRR